MLSLGADDEVNTIYSPKKYDSSTLDSCALIRREGNATMFCSWIHRFVAHKLFYLIRFVFWVFNIYTSNFMKKHGEKLSLMKLLCVIIQTTFRWKPYIILDKKKYFLFHFFVINDWKMHIVAFLKPKNKDRGWQNF